MAEDNPNILILGGTGFIGRNLLTYLVAQGGYGSIKVVDKLPPTVAFFSEEQRAALASKGVKFKQGNAQSPVSLEKIFKLKGDKKVDYVINLAAETKYGQPDVVYQERITDIAKCVIAECKKHPSIKKIIEISTAQVYGSEKKASLEGGKIKPWTAIAEQKVEVEKLWKASGLPVIILRPSIVYGPGDVHGLMPRITIGRVYRSLGQKMKFLWGGDLKINTVHVRDVAAAIWHCCKLKETDQIYNLSDKGDTDQKKLNTILEGVFGIKTTFTNALTNKVAKLNMKSVTETVNDKHLKPWSMLCARSKIESTPLSPYLAPELLYDHDLYVNGSEIEKTGFKYEVPNITQELVQEAVDYWLAMSVFPPLDDGPVDAADIDSDDDLDAEE